MIIPGAAQGALLALAAYAFMACGDALIKGAGPGLSVFEIGLYVGTISMIATLFMRPRGERWRDVLLMRHPWLVLARSLTGMGAGFLGIFAFTTIPFAEAYALIFMAPFVVVLLSIILLGERISALGWGAMIAGGIGAFLIIRPGLRQIEPGHLAALGVAVCAGLTVVILRRISGTEKRTSLLGVPMILSVMVSAAGSASDFTMPHLGQYAFLVASGVLAALGQLALLGASRRAPASEVGQAQYSQLIWAMLIGLAFYGETPDALTLAGIAIIAMAGVVTVLSSPHPAAPAVCQTD
ncbi:MAG TPA: DMT family transporter [Devosia sp.]|nr:DMT family transporter [Devosia sp.]